LSLPADLRLGPAMPGRCCCWQRAFDLASQLGDLFESAVKRRFASRIPANIIPGTAVADRLDGFVPLSRWRRFSIFAGRAMRRPSYGLVKYERCSVA